jgi:hypothetical protein
MPDDTVKRPITSEIATVRRNIDLFYGWLDRVDFNFGPRPRDGYPRMWRRTDPEEVLKPLAERDKILVVDTGLKDRIPEVCIEATDGIPLAKEDEKTIGQGQNEELEGGLAQRRKEGNGHKGGVTFRTHPAKPAMALDVRFHETNRNQCSMKMINEHLSPVHPPATLSNIWTRNSPGKTPWFGILIWIKVICIAGLAILGSGLSQFRLSIDWHHLL